MPRLHNNVPPLNPRHKPITQKIGSKKALFVFCCVPFLFDRHFPRLRPLSTRRIVSSIYSFSGHIFSDFEAVGAVCVGSIQNKSIPPLSKMHVLPSNVTKSFRIAVARVFV